MLLVWGQCVPHAGVEGLWDRLLEVGSPAGQSFFSVAHGEDQRAGEPALRGKHERVGSFHPREEKACEGGSSLYANT